tara:strand:- start:26672 stop:28522 length:1851 start_codon:yes stop_codon:yes gene_type:complete
MANQFAKKNIDFDVYERQDPASTVDWGKAAKDIADSFQGVVDEREKRKGEIEKAYQDQQKALNDIGEYDNPTIQQFVMNGGQDAANKNLDFYNLMKRGLVKPEDYEMFKHNQKTGFDLMKKNAANFDKKFQEYTQRVQDGTGAPGEEWIGKQLEGFAKLNNMQLESDPETGNMVMLKIDPETGEPIPGSSMSVQHMTLMMEQKIDNFDVGEATTGIKNELGKIITADFELRGITGTVTTEERSRAETEFFATEDGQKFLNLKAQQMISNPYNQQSMMMNAGLTTEDGTAFQIGSQEEYDKWNEENPDNESNNPYLVMEFGEDNVYRPKFNEAQNKIAEDYAKDQITSALDVKESVSAQKIQKTQQYAPEYVYKRGDEKKDMLAIGKNVNLLTSGDPRQRKAAAEAIGAETGADIQVVVDDNGVTTEFIITKPGETAKRISAFAEDENGQPDPNQPLTVDELNRSIYEHAVDGSNYDQWLDAGGVVGKDVGTGGVDVKQAGQRIDYTPMAVADVKEFLGMGDSLLGQFRTSAIIDKFDQMLTNEAFWPESMKGIDKSVKEEDGNIVFTIGNETISFPNKNATTTQEIVDGVQNLMKQVVNDINQGGGGDKTGGKYNK